MVKDTIREIKQRLFQFVAIILIISLGVGFFIGIRVTGYNMRTTLDQYTIDTNMPLLVVQSSIAFDNEMIDEIKALTNTKIEGVKMGDVLIENPSTTTTEVMRLYEYNQSKNDLVLVDGKWPTKKGQIVLDNELTQYQIGDIIEIEKGDYISNQKVEVVGFVESILYLNKTRGSSQIGTGQINGFGYVLDLQIEESIFSAIRIYAPQDQLDTIINLLTENEDTLTLNRYNRIVEPELIKLEDGQREIDDALLEIEEGKNEIISSKKQLENALQEIRNQRNTLTENKEEGQKKFESSYQELIKNQQELENSITAFNGEKIEGDLNQQINTAQTNFEFKMDLAQQQFASQLEMINQQTDSAIKQQMMDAYMKEYEAFESQRIYGETVLEQLRNGVNQLNDGFIQYEKELENFNVQMKSYENQLNKAELEIENGFNQINIQETKINDALIELEKAQVKIDDGYKQIEKNKNASLYINDRSEFAIGYQEFYDDSVRIEGIGKVFPLLFFGVALLVTLSTITRMIDESRNQIGIYKALGYTWLQASIKFIGFVFFAWLFGSIVGMAFGFYFIPTLIYNAYRLMYLTPDMIGGIVLSYAWLPLLISFMSSVGVVIAKAYQTTKGAASNLMRPAAPKGGQRLLLERIPFIWNRMNFLYKVSIRNLFRNKVRMLMTIVGIGGCTGLLIVGFGLSDSVTGIFDKQFVELTSYDANVIYNESFKPVNGMKDVYDLVAHKVTAEDNTEMTMYVVEDLNALSKYMILRDRKTQNPLDLNQDSVIVSEKIAKLNNWNVNDIITITIDNKAYDFILTGINEHYVAHYLYITQSHLNEVTGKTFENNLALFNYGGDKDTIFSELLEQSNVLQVIDIQESIAEQEDAMGSFDYVIWVVTIAAFALELIVLLNLITMNMSERYKELATLKVLGFYPKELAAYILRENIFLTVISVLVGCVFGKLLHAYVMGAVEIDLIMFNRNIKLTSYLMALGFTFGISIITNLLMAKRMDHVNMSEALKTFDE